MDREDLFQLILLLKKLYEVRGLYCPLKESVFKLQKQIFKHVDSITREV